MLDRIGDLHEQQFITGEEERWMILVKPKINHKLTKPGVWDIEIQNALDEEVIYPEIPQNLDAVAIDIGQVTLINSSGIRNWIRWIGAVSIRVTYKKVEISRVPLAFVRAVNLVAEVLPEPVVVKSFFVNYFCYKCDKDRKVLLENKGDLKLTSQPCEVCTQVMSLELSEKSYDCFLNRRGEAS